MAEQLVLLDEDRLDEERKAVRLDELTCEIGRRGVADARRVLLETVQAACERSTTAAAA
jgi:hypothetical protein